MTDAAVIVAVVALGIGGLYGVLALVVGLVALEFEWRDRRDERWEEES